jgi:membrane protein EpsK
LLGKISFNKLLPEIKFEIKNFRLRKAYELLSAGAFNSVILLGSTLMTQIDLLVGNKFLNASVVGEYAVILLFMSAIRSIASAISSAFSPTTLAVYAQGKLNELRDYSNSVVRFCGLIIGWPISIIACLGIAFLQLWLMRDFSQYIYLILCMTIPLVPILAVLQLNVLCQAVNKVKVPAAATVLAGVLNIALAILSVSVFKLGFWGIAMSSVLSFALRNLVFMPVYVSKITNQSVTAYYKGLYKPTIIASFVCYVGFMLNNSIIIDTIIRFIIASVGLSILYFICSYLSLSGEEKLKLRSFIKNNLPKNLNLRSK